MTSVYDFEAKRLDGKTVKLDAYRGKALLIVNTASQCGFTPQYRGLEALYRRYKSSGFAVLGFPCNQFGHQERGDAEEIRTFCSTSYDVTFPMFAKIDVNGPRAHPLFVYLKAEAPGLLGSKSIKWNFTKFLVDAEGKPRGRSPPTAEPASLAASIQRLLPKS